MRSYLRLSMFAPALWLGLWALSAQAQSLPEVELRDASGSMHSRKEMLGAKGAVLFFIASECPISNRYAPEIHRIAAAYQARGVSFFAVQSDPDLTVEAAARHAREYGYAFPVLLDPKQILASALGVLVTPAAVLLSPEGKSLYRGRIDNRYLDFGRYRDAGITPDLRNALDAVLARKPVPTPVTKAIGCGLPPIPAEKKEN
ncbi:MAG: redoxin domain-containing protein [Blastocatellia bacterium]|nr:redoxin domain-containing protein [Blastocatellia bacterium]